jgi:hypothetical protein
MMDSTSHFPGLRHQHERLAILFRAVVQAGDGVVGVLT